MSLEIRAVVFDLGGVLIDWNPRYVYRQIFPTEEEVEWFLENITTLAWNEQQDAGYPIAQATEELVARHPEWESQIRAYYERWKEMLADPIAGSVELFRKLKENSRLKFYALTNWSAELFPYALENFYFLQWFDGIVVSGEEKMRKPQPEIFRLLLERYGLQAGDTLFVDDNLRNVKAAEAIGLPALHFSSPQTLEKDFRRLGLL
ncbi:MAG TPA: HAD family phosphatase [Chitinophagaceae bacterium]|nr:HAD family phosphatase [Chitinophagaceae bacterium]